MAAGVIIDTSGYASDCNFSDLMPQHAMKPLRFLATMELIKALRIVEKANEWASRAEEESGARETVSMKCGATSPRDDAANSEGQTIQDAPSYEEGYESIPGCNRRSSESSNAGSIEGQKEMSKLGEKIIVCVNERETHQEDQGESENAPVGEERHGTMAEATPRSENNSSSKKEKPMTPSRSAPGIPPQRVKREREENEACNITTEEDQKGKDEAVLSLPPSSETVLKVELERADEIFQSESNRKPLKDEENDTSCAESHMPPFSLPEVPAKRKGAGGTRPARRAHLGMKVAKKSSRCRPPRLSPTPVPSSVLLGPSLSAMKENAAAKVVERGGGKVAPASPPEEKVPTSTSSPFSSSSFATLHPLPPIHAPSPQGRGESAFSSSAAASSLLHPTSPSVLPPPSLSSSYRIIVPPLLSLEELEKVHALPYLGNLGLHNTASWQWMPQTSRAYFSVDCPPVEGIVEHSLATASGTVMGAVLLNARRTNLAIHWGGGMHHTKCGECSGFCYVNDIVLGIVELLRAHERVLYVDLDAHHGDGVDEAFCQSNRVFTLSLHKFGDGFFPGTGHPRDTGVGEGLHYTMNLSLWDGINDYFYVAIFSVALKAIVGTFRPDAIVLQCGADSLGGDRLGTFNLSSWGHGACVQLVKETLLPLLVLGGGGYTIRNVAKLWAYETAILCSNRGGCASSPILVPLNARIPVENMPLSGWLFVDQPHLLVPADGSRRVTAGWQVQRGYRAILDQIEFATEKLKVAEEGRRRTEGKEKIVTPNSPVDKPI